MTRQKILLGAFLVDALENDSVHGLKEYTANELPKFLSRKSDKDLMIDLVESLGGTIPNESYENRKSVVAGNNYQPNSH